MEGVPSRFLYENMIAEDSIRDLRYRYFLCVQIDLNVVSRQDACNRYNLEQETLEEWILNYLPYRQELTNRAVDDYGIKMLTEFSNRPRGSPADEALFSEQIGALIMKQTRYSAERYELRQLLVEDDPYRRRKLDVKGLMSTMKPWRQQSAVLLTR